MSLAQAKSTSSSDYLPDILSPDELSEEMNLGKAQSLSDPSEVDSFAPQSLDDWSSLNGIDITQYFQVVVLVNKAKSGSTAQTAQVYFEGQYYTTYEVSTGRERMEKAPSGKVYRSVTPEGWFRPILFSPNHYSRTWDAPMKWAVFFNGGIALHATTRSHYDELGRRASGGCVRLREDDAEELYHLIKNAGKAYVPKFSRSGKIKLDKSGELAFEYNYDTLIIVENNSN